MIKLNRLFWLGRYSERTLIMAPLMMKQYDRLIDSHGVAYSKILAGLCVPDTYGDEQTFVQRFLFDPGDTRSVAAAVRSMLDNAMVLRETITSPTLAYVQMAMTAMESAQDSGTPGVWLQWVVDDINAFRGSCEDSVADSNLRNIVKTGVSVERLSLRLRLDLQPEDMGMEIRRLLSRVNRTRLPRREEYFVELMQHAYRPDNEAVYPDPLILKYVEGLCEV